MDAKTNRGKIISGRVAETFVKLGLAKKIISDIIIPNEEPVVKKATEKPVAKKGRPKK